MYCEKQENPQMLKVQETLQEPKGPDCGILRQSASVSVWMSGGKQQATRQKLQCDTTEPYS